MYDKNYYDKFEWNQYYYINTAILKQFLKLPDKSKLLDIGCGTGFHVAGWLKNSIDAYGCDFSVHAIEKAKLIDTNRFIVADVRRKLPYADKEFDIVTCFDLVEHLDEEYIKPLIKEMRRLSKMWVIVQTLFADEEHHMDMWSRDTTHKLWKPKQWWLEQIETTKYGYLMKPFEMMSPGGIILKFPHPDQLIITTSEEEK